MTYGLTENGVRSRCRDCVEVCPAARRSSLRTVLAAAEGSKIPARLTAGLRDARKRARGCLGRVDTHQLR